MFLFAHSTTLSFVKHILHLDLKERLLFVFFFFFYEFWHSRVI